MALETNSPIQSNLPQKAAYSTEQAARDANTAAKQAVENKQAAAEDQTKATAKSKPVVSSFADIQLKFQVDSKTNALTVLIFDRAAKRLIRTIPPDEVNKMQNGDLVEMLS